jgi:hypothetical protein
VPTRRIVDDTLDVTYSRMLSHHCHDGAPRGCSRFRSKAYLGTVRSQIVPFIPDGFGMQSLRCRHRFARPSVL